MNLNKEQSLEVHAKMQSLMRLIQDEYALNVKEAIRVMYGALTLEYFDVHGLSQETFTECLNFIHFIVHHIITEMHGGVIKQVAPAVETLQ